MCTHRWTTGIDRSSPHVWPTNKHSGWRGIALKYLPRILILILGCLSDYMHCLLEEWQSAGFVVWRCKQNLPRGRVVLTTSMATLKNRQTCLFRACTAIALYHSKQRECGSVHMFCRITTNNDSLGRVGWLPRWLEWYPSGFVWFSHRTSNSWWQ